MNQEMESRTVPPEEEIDLTELFRALSRRWRLILGITAASAAVAMVVSLLLPVYYKAETSILPPQDKGSNLAAQVMGQAGGLIALAGGAAGVKSQGELFVAMTKSRTVLDRMVDRFDLMKLYQGKYREDARMNLVGSIKVQEDRKSGIISLTVEDRDPKRAADMANAFVEELKSLAGGLAISEAGQQRMFFEDQIRQTKESLARAEEELKGFQQRTGMFQVDAQARAIIEGIARLRASIASKEVEAKVLRSFATAQNPDLQRVEEEIRALRIELEKVETSKGSGVDPLMSSGRVPEMGTEYLRKLRQLKYNETLFELLSKQYELAKLDEARDAVVIQVIDRAVPPERKSRPKRALIVILATAAMFFLSVFIVLLLEHPWNKSRKPPVDDSSTTENRTS
ncbi:MAG: Wzz/FepE/Etk N-terminal domain-containing protein [Deltaproteobacteria bacterium]|nr:Wzz/FepE/Etk N-terminal domain-containing protein [Candidatus Deferrimicrobium borealis]